MSRLSFMEKLLDGVEVEWKVLGDSDFIEVANSGRKPVKASLREAGSTPYYGANNIQDYVDGFTHDGEYVLIAEDGSASLESYSIQYTSGKFWANNHVHVIRGKSGLNTRFLYHYLCIVNFIPFLTGGGRAKLTKGKMIEIQIPIPCPDNPKKSLEIQAEIVRILDTFTELTAELTAELSMRKKQYNYYRDKLLTFEEGEVEWRTLGECFPQIRNGFVGTVTPFYTESSIGIRYLQGTNIKNGKINDKKVFFVTKEFHHRQKKTILRADDILVVQSGHVGDSAVVGSEYQGSNCHALIVMSNGGSCNSKFVNYYLQSCEGKAKLARIVTGGTVKHILASKIKKVIIPLPPLAEQARIVSILDKFDTLTNSISEGLPREIELRQKQYEYYRDLLLSFPKPAESEAMSA